MKVPFHTNSTGFTSEPSKFSQETVQLILDEKRYSKIGTQTVEVVLGTCVGLPVQVILCNGYNRRIQYYILLLSNSVSSAVFFSSRKEVLNIELGFNEVEYTYFSWALTS